MTAGPAAIATSRRHVAWRQYASGASGHSSSCQARGLAERRPQLLERRARRRVVAVLDRRVEPRQLGAVLDLLRFGCRIAARSPGDGRFMPGIFT